MDKSIITKFEAYLLTEKRVSTNTFNAYKSDLEQFMAFLQSRNILLQDASRQHIKNFLLYLKTMSLSARSMARKISSLKVFFSYLHRQVGFNNLADDLTFPKIDKKLPLYLAENEVEQLLAIAEQDKTNIGMRNKVILYLLYVSGMRISELTGLKLSDIHFDTGFITVQGKGGKGRMIPIPQPMMSMLAEYIQTVHRIFARKRKTDYLFPIYYAGRVKPISRQAFWIILKQLCKKTGIKRSISPHQLRHSLATHMLKNGADLRSLQLLLGHENLSTVQIYTHVETSHLRKVYDKKHPRS